MIRKRILLTVSLLIFCSTVWGSPKNAITDYAFAQKCYYSLDKSISKGWDRCIKQFQKIVEGYPKLEEAPKALFSVAKLYQEKFEITQADADLQKAFATYNQFLKANPKHPLADDGLFRIAVLRFEKQKDRARAEKAIQALLERYPDGDMAMKAKEYLQKVQGTGYSVQGTALRPVITAQNDEEEKGVTSHESRATNHPSTRLRAGEPRTTLRHGSGQASHEPIKTIVIDPGHGGNDIGAIGHKGTKEAQVALQIARKLAFKLRNELGLNVYLTRTKNKTVSLEERNRFANLKKADLFISIHANANESPKVHGIQTFYLNNATNEAAKRLATRENKQTGKKLDRTQKILSTMLQNANTEESRDLAHAIQKSLVFRLGKVYPPTKDLKVDAALFYVLVGSKAPSVLVETSFITNPREEKRLRDSNYQWSLADAMAKGVESYVESRGKVASSL